MTEKSYSDASCCPLSFFFGIEKKGQTKLKIWSILPTRKRRIKLSDYKKHYTIKHDKNQGIGAEILSVFIPHAKIIIFL